jgi:outer membrane lipase/esterase
MSRRRSGVAARRLAWVSFGAVSLLALPAAASAQAVYTQQVVYGDSYADNGNLINGSYFNPNQPYPRQVTTNVGFLTFFVYPTPLQHLLGIPDAGMFDYAFGGATTGPGVPGLILGYQQQIDASLALGQRFGPRTLVTINIGGNDGGAAEGGLSLAQAPGTAATASTNLANGVGTLIGAGAHNFMISTFDDVSTVPDIFDGSHGQGAIAADKLYGALFFAGEEAKLAPYAEAGARIFTFNLSQFAREVDADPARYGFTNVLTPCANTPACATPTSPGQFTNATFDGLHLTTGGFLYVARYEANLLAAPATYPAEPEATLAVADSFATALFGRLEAYRDLSGAAPAQPVIFYVEANGGGGTTGGRLDATGFSYDDVGGSIGVEYQPNAGVRLGAAFDYARPSVDLAGGAGHFDMDSYQAAAYASFGAPSWYVDLAGIYGFGDLSARRPGVVDTIQGGTSLDSVTLAARAGYYVQAQPFLVGPVVGLRYADARVDNYTESGDPLLTFDVSAQTQQSLIGSAGLAARYPTAIGALPVTPYLQLTAEHDFFDGHEVLITTETQSRVLPIVTPIAGPGERSWGKVLGGAAAALDQQVSLSVTVGSTFGRAGGDDYVAAAGLKISF